jgi:dienelactone hydrolase
MIRATAVLALAMLAAACATKPPIPLVAAPMADAPPFLRTFVPVGGDKHPVVLLVPGCDAPLISSRAALYERYAIRLRDEGFAVGIVSYEGSELGEPACRITATPGIIENAIQRAASQMQAMPGIDRTRLHLVGWSWGGRGVLQAVKAKVPVSGLISAVAFYPVCPEAELFATRVTLLMLMGEADTTAPWAKCRAWADKSDGPGPVVITRYVGVEHGFDVPEAGDASFASYSTGTPLTFDASTAWQAWKDMVSFLKLDLDGS